MPITIQHAEHLTPAQMQHKGIVRRYLAKVSGERQRRLRLRIALKTLVPFPRIGYKMKGENSAQSATF